jgi:hypothetical protein
MAAAAEWRLGGGRPKAEAEEEAPGAPPSKRRGAGGEDRKNKKEDEDEDTIDVQPMELTEIIKLLAKGQLQIFQQIREIVAGSWATYESEETELTTASIEAGKKYNEVVKEKGRGHGLGSPHIHVLLAAIEADLPHLNDDLKKQLKDIAKALETKGKKYISEHFFHFRVKEMYNKTETGNTRYKIELGLNLFAEFSMECQDFDGNNVAGIVQMHHLYQLFDRILTAGDKAKRLTGAPPRGPIERQLSKYLAKGVIPAEKGSSSSSQKDKKEDKKDKKDSKDSKPTAKARASKKN